MVCCADFIHRGDDCFPARVHARVCARWGPIIQVRRAPLVHTDARACVFGSCAPGCADAAQGRVRGFVAQRVPPVGELRRRHVCAAVPIYALREGLLPVHYAGAARSGVCVLGSAVTCMSHAIRSPPLRKTGSTSYSSSVTLSSPGTCASTSCWLRCVGCWTEMHLRTGRASQNCRCYSRAHRTGEPRCLMRTVSSTRRCWQRCDDVRRGCPRGALAAPAAPRRRRRSALSRWRRRLS